MWTGARDRSFESYVVSVSSITPVPVTAIKPAITIGFIYEDTTERRKTYLSAIHHTCILNHDNTYGESGKMVGRLHFTIMPSDYIELISFG